MQDKLDFCPFCGGKATLRTVVNQHFVECRKCWAHSSHASGINYTAEQAITAWNRRITQPNEPLTCNGCVHFSEDDLSEPCTECVRLNRKDLYRTKPEVEK